MSKLVNCKACQKEIAKGVNKCPSCGKDQRNFFGQHKILVGIVVVIVLGIIGSNMGNTPTKVATTDTSTTVASTTETPTAPAKPTVPTEYISALAKAETYGTMMDMSKAGIYDQLISSAGDKFSPKSAQYAIDNVKIDWNANALKKAQTYQKTMAMSPSAVYDQLISSAGDKFTTAEAQYAKDNLK
ncbi:Ltp family lipoprotein [Clostridium estertheticum]|uniref:Ltp family lipoprotein n=1 Tax=Clostridium estertheticum TaxID=238834 RepID=UPI001C0C01BF|nr:Ltp family lipoprotein [Clostridium estertheticum]MBU3172759.1 Ltp family lipoprotein [Clostridium estertheticum]